MTRAATGIACLTMKLEGDEQNWLAALAGTFLSTLLLGWLTKVLLRLDFLFGVISGCAVGFLFGIAVMARQYGAPENMPGWVLDRAQSGWRFTIHIFLWFLLVGIIGILTVGWKSLLYRRFGFEAVSYWEDIFLILLIPLFIVAGVLYLIWIYS